MRWFRLLVLALLFMVAVFSAVPVTSQNPCDAPAVSYILAARAYSRGDYETAVAAYSCYLEANPTDIRAYYRRGDAHLLLGHYSRALNDYRMGTYFDSSLVLLNAETDARRDAVNASPNEVNPRMLRAAWYWAINMDSSAAPDYQVLLGWEPDSVFAQLMRGSSRFFAGEWERGQQDFDNVLLDAPDNAEVLAVMALTNMYVGNFEEAVAQATRAIELDPNLLMAYRARGSSNANLGNTEAAIADLRRLINMLPDEYGVARIDLANVYFGVGDTVNGEAVLAEAEQLAVDDPQLHLIMGWEFLTRDQPRAADYFMHWLADIGMTPAAEPNHMAVGERVDVHVTYQTCYNLEFEATEGQVLTFSASSAGGFDPLIVLLDPRGNGLAANDDVNYMNDISSRISDFVIPADGTYTLVVAHAGLSVDGVTRVRIND